MKKGEPGYYPTAFLTLFILGFTYIQLSKYMKFRHYTPSPVLSGVAKNISPASFEINGIRVRMHTLYVKEPPKDCLKLSATECTKLMSSQLESVLKGNKIN